MTGTFEELKRLISTPELPDLGPGPRAGVLSQGALNNIINDFLRTAKLSSTNGELVRSLVLLWHDQLEAAHVIAQDIGNADGSFVHGIVHRREPDYGNAKYWFCRVGKHPCFPKLAGQLGALLDLSTTGGLSEYFIQGGEW